MTRRGVHLNRITVVALISATFFALGIVTLIFGYRYYVSVPQEVRWMLESDQGMTGTDQEFASEMADVFGLVRVVTQMNGSNIAVVYNSGLATAGFNSGNWFKSDQLAAKFYFVTFETFGLIPKDPAAAGHMGAGEDMDFVASHALFAVDLQGKVWPGDTIYLRWSPFGKPDNAYAYDQASGIAVEVYSYNHGWLRPDGSKQPVQEKSSANM